jgi:ribosome-associated protein
VSLIGTPRYSRILEPPNFVSRSDEQRHRITVRDNVHATPDEEHPVVSKTRRKAEMHALQDVGVALVGLDPRHLEAMLHEIELPDRLREAIVEARGITAHGGRKRQLQYIGKLMREVDAEPITRWLDRLAHGQQQDAARLHRVERWRDQLLADADALDALMAEHPTLDRPRLRALIAKARDERARGAAPHAYRDLFRALKDVLDHDDV